MKRYWDSSALIEAVQHSEVERMAREPHQYTRLHSLAEVFSTLTGGKLPFRYDGEDAAEMIGDLTSGMEFVDLTRSEVIKALKETASNGVRGGHVHDWLHIEAAKKAKVERILTLNVGHFRDFASGLDVTQP